MRTQQPDKIVRHSSIISRLSRWLAPRDSSDSEPAVILVVGNNTALVQAFVRDCLKTELPTAPDKIGFDIGTKHVYVWRGKFFSFKSLTHLISDIYEEHKEPRYCYLVKSETPFLNKSMFLHLVENRNAVMVKENTWEVVSFDEALAFLTNECV